MILAKFTFVRFVPPIEKFLVLQTPCLRPFRKKKNQIQIGYLIFVFSYLLVARTMHIANNFSCYVSVMDDIFTENQTTNIFQKVKRKYSAFDKIFFFKFYNIYINKSNYFINLFILLCFFKINIFCGYLEIFNIIENIRKFFIC